MCKQSIIKAISNFKYFTGSFLMSLRRSQILTKLFLRKVIRKTRRPGLAARGATAGGWEFWAGWAGWAIGGGRFC